MNIVTLNFEKKSDKSIYKQLAMHVISEIKEGHIKKGDRLPSVRSLSKQLDLSKSTISNAYDYLVSEGYLSTKAKSGYYCDVPSMKVSSHSLLDNSIKEDHPYLYNLSSRAVDLSSFDTKVWKRYIKNILVQDFIINSYGDNQGEQQLRHALATYLYQNRSCNTSSKELYIGAGIQPLLYFLFSLFRDQSLKVGFYKEEVSQVSAIVLDCKNEVKIISSLDEIRKENIDMLYLAPNNLNLSLNDKIELLRTLEKEHIYLIEDDYNGEMHYLSSTKSAMQSLVDDKLVIYLNSFSRLLIPSCRIACMVLPSPLLDKASKQKASYNQTASKIEQLVLSQYIEDGHLERRIKYLKKSYKAKYQIMYECLLTYLDKEEIYFDEANTRFIILKEFDELFYKNIESKKIRVSKIQNKLALYFSGIQAKDITSAISLIFN